MGTITGAVIASMMGIICLEPHGGEGGARGVEENGKRKIFKRSVVEGVVSLIQHQSYYNYMVLEQVPKYLHWCYLILLGVRRSRLITNKVQPHMFSNYTHYLSSKSPFPHTTTLPLCPAVQLLDISLREHPPGPHPVGHPGVQAPLAEGKIAMPLKSG